MPAHNTRPHGPITLTSAVPTVGTTDGLTFTLGQPQWPEFLRLPRTRQRCPVTGLSRAALNSLILGPNPLVRSICLRQTGALRGVRLIVTASLLAHLHGQREGASR